MKVALYVRVSHDDQAKFGISIDAQKESLIKYCNDNKLKYDLFIDEGISGGSILKRPALMKFLDNIDNYSTLLFTKLDRLSRNVKDAITLNETLQKHNVKMIAINDQYIDTSTANGEFIFNLRYALAQQERKQDSERIKAVFDYKVKVSKEVISGSKIYGYDIVDKHYIINEQEAENIRLLFNQYLKLGSLNKTRDWWASIGMNELTETVRLRLKNIRYNGRYLYNDVEYNDYIPKIVDDNIFNEVQKLLKNNYKIYPNKSKKENCYIFSGIVHCAECGKTLTGSRPEKTGHKYYSCYNYGKHKCNNTHYYREDAILNEVINNIPQLIKNYNFELEKPKKRIIDNSSAIKNKISKLQDLYINDKIDLESYSKKYDELQLELKKCKIETTPINQEVLKLKNVNLLELFNELTEQNKQIFFKRIGLRVDITKDKKILIKISSN